MPYLRAEVPRGVIVVALLLECVIALAVAVGH